MNDSEHGPSSDASSAVLRLGVLGAADGWYMQDLMRAAQHLSGGRAVRIQPLAFSELQVAYWGGHQPIASAGEVSPADAVSPVPDLRRSLDALMVRTMPLGSLEQTIFRMNALHVAERSGTRVVNPPRALEIAIDKWLTLDTLRRAGLEIPRTICCQTRGQAMEGWRALGSDCVVKPIFGGEGRGIMRVTDPDMAWRVFSTLEQLQSVMYLQEFLESPGYDLRLLVIADAVFCVRRENRSDWRTNVSRGGTACAESPSFEQVSMAFAACKAIGAWMAGVDILPTRDGRNVLLEVNAVPGWKATASALGVDIAQVILEQLMAHVEAR